MLTSALKVQFMANGRGLELNLAGITDDEALVQPPGGGNCLNWVVGHIVASRELILAHLREEPVWVEDVARRYDRGSAPIRSPSQAPAALIQLRELFQASQERIVRGLEAISAEALEEPLPDGDLMRGQQLAFLQFHEAYHVGQTGLLRRLLGKDGAIP